MNLAYTVLSGKIKCDNDWTEIPFALVFVSNGLFSVETFVKDESFFERHKMQDYFILQGITEKGYDIEITGLAYTLYETANQKFTFRSQGHLKLENNKESFPTPKVYPTEYKLWFIEVEGLRLKFADHTEVRKFRDEGKLNEFNNFHFDHTNCSTIINGISEGNYFHLQFSKNPTNDNILIDFRWQDGHCEMKYDEYLKIKNDLISYLSFINDRKVFVRRELTGKFYTEGAKRYDAQTVFIYSRAESVSERLQNYLPIEDFPQILTDLFFYSFDEYVTLNKELNFNSLVFSLNNSTEVNGLEERYFILITALEKISTNFSKANKGKSVLIDSEEFNKKLKPKLTSAIEFLRDENADAWNIMNSRLGNINTRNQNDTVQKLYEFLNFAKIPINKNIVDLIEVERHQAVHEGVIGQSKNEMVTNYFKLDHLLRDIILNLIGYRNHRYRKFNYASKEEFEKAYPKNDKVPYIKIR